MHSDPKSFPVGPVPSVPVLNDPNVSETPVEKILPFPKAAQRKTSKTNARKRRTSILTDTPVEEALEAEKRATMENRTKKGQRRVLQDDKKTTAPTKSKRATSACRKKDEDQCEKKESNRHKCILLGLSRFVARMYERGRMDSVHKM